MLSNWHYITKVPFYVPDYKRKFLKNTYPLNILCTALLIFYCTVGDFLKEESKRTLQFARTFLRQILKIFKETVSQEEIYMSWLFSDFVEGIKSPTADRGLSKKLVRLAAVENSKYVDDNLLIKNPGSNNGKRAAIMKQQQLVDVGSRSQRSNLISHTRWTQTPVLLSGTSAPVCVRLKLKNSTR